MWCQKYQQPFKRALLSTPLRATAGFHSSVKLNNLKESKVS